jgi:hypothetical protein
MRTWPLLVDRRGSAFIQKAAVIGLFVLAGLTGVSALGGATRDKFICIAAAIAGEPCEATPGLPPPPVAAPGARAEAPFSSLDYQVDPSTTRDPTPEEQAKIDAAASSDAQFKDMHDKTIAAGWTIKVGPAGGSIYADPATKTVVIPVDMLDNPGQLLSYLIHELAHTHYTYGENPLTLNYKECVDAQLTNEGHAVLHEFGLMDRLCAAAHPDCQAVTEWLRSDPAFYEVGIDIWNRYEAGQITAEQASYEFGQLYGTQINSITNEPYTAYYGAACASRPGAPPPA